MSTPSLAKYLAIGAGAGLSSALLFAVTATMSPLSLFLSYVAPLPIVIAALGWAPLIGLFGLAVGAAALSVTVGSKGALAFALGIASPALALSAFAMARLPLKDGGARPPSHGAILAAAAGASGIMTLGSALTVGGGSFDAYAATMKRAIEGLIRYQMNLPADGPLVLQGGVPGDEIVAMMVAIFPIAIGASFLPLVVANLWAGAKIVAVSGRLPIPWVPAYTAQMPAWILGALVLASAVSLVDHFPGVLARGLIGGILAALSFQALAAIHDRTRGRPGRPVILGLLYGLLAMTLGWAMPFLAIYGLVDLFVRRRAADAT